MSLIFVDALKILPTSSSFATALRSPALSCERLGARRIVWLLSMIGWLFSIGQ